MFYFGQIAQSCLKKIHYMITHYLEISQCVDSFDERSKFLRLGEWVSFWINSFYRHTVSFRIKSIIFRSGLAHMQNAVAMSTIEKSFYISVLVVYGL